MPRRASCRAQGPRRTVHSTVPPEGQGRAKTQRGSEEHSPEVQYRVQNHIGAVQSSVPQKGSAEAQCPSREVQNTVPQRG